MLESGEREGVKARDGMIGESESESERERERERERGREREKERESFNSLTVAKFEQVMFYFSRVELK